MLVFGERMIIYCVHFYASAKIAGKLIRMLQNDNFLYLFSNYPFNMVSGRLTITQVNGSEQKRPCESE